MEIFPQDFASLIYRRSGGNALFMVTILQDIAKKGLIAQVDGKWTLAAPIETVAQNVPETLDQLIDAQFQQLSAVEQRVLRSASVAGERFSAWAVSTAAEIDPGEIEDSLRGPRRKTSVHQMFRNQRTEQWRSIRAL